MAKQEDADAPKGRLLFTDFAISEKGRPPGLSRPSGATALAKPLPTLRDVISSLDISFEADDDDRDEPDFPSPRDESAPGGAQSDGSGPDDDTADSLFEALEEDESGGDTGPGREGPARPAPLDGFLSTFTPLDEPDTEEIAFAGTPGGDDTDLDPDFDLASLSAPRGSPPSVSTGDAASEPDDAAWLAIVNRMLDNIGPEDDILSLVPSDAGETTSDRAGRKATRIHVPPPRPWPYGGIERVDNWYVPPEEGAAAALSGHPARVDNWYEPPEPSAQADETALLGSADELFAGLDIGKAWEARTAPLRSDTTETDTADELFAEFTDLFGKLPDQAAAPAPAMDEPTASDVDILSEVTPEESARFRRSQPDALAARAESDAEPAAEAPAPGPEPEPVVQPKAKTQPKSVRVKAARPAETHTDIRVDIDFDDDGEVDMDSLGNAIADAYHFAGREAGEAHAVVADEEPDAGHGRDGEPAAREESGAGAVDTVEIAVPAAAGAPELFPSATDEPVAENADREEAAVRADPLAAEHSDIGDGDDDIGFDDLDSLVDAVGGGPVSHDIAPPVISDDDVDMETGKFAKQPAAEDDYLPGSEGVPADGAGAEADGSGGDGEPGEEDVAVNPMDVFANMDALDDFGDDALDDEMRAMLDDDEGEADEAGGEGAPDAVRAAPPRELGPVGRIVAKITGKLENKLPMGKLRQINEVLAWRENWWFYCDLVAAIIATASLAVIASYFLWYR